MSFNKYVCAQVSTLCICLISLILVFDCKYKVLPFNTISILLYLILGLLLTIWSSFVILYNIVNQVEPYNVGKHVKYKNLISICGSLLSETKLHKWRISTEGIIGVDQDADERIAKFVSAIERVYVRNWYVNYISTDQQFLTETSNILDVVARRCLQFSDQINSDKLIHGGLIILLKHVKEYRKAAIKSKTHGGSVEQQYRYSHVASNNINAFEHFAQQFTAKVFRHLINWELYNSLASQCLISIIAKKLICSLLSITSSPAFINMKILKWTSASATDQLISISDVDHADSATSLITTVNAVCPTESPMRRQNHKILVQDSREPVKIYESKSPCRIDHHTWTNSSDLESISIGQDLLDYTNISKLWTDDGAPSENLSSEHSSSPANIFKCGGNGTMKELQQNVVKPVSQATSNAMHKIGDFQDEAAGVMEGILDFGMAGIRKGLRLTGLQPEVSELGDPGLDMSSKYHGKAVQLGHPELDVSSSIPSIDFEADHIWVNPLLKSECSPTFEGDLLESCPLVGCQRRIPTMEILHVLDNSPEPEYDDNADLATSAAKLRSLLAQRTTESAVATPAASPNICMTPLDPAGTSIEDLSEVDGALPSMYKAWGWARTATGVFQNTIKNTIKTSLEPAFDCDAAPHLPDAAPAALHFAFVEADAQAHHLAGHVKKLLAERRVFCTIDNAYEAIDAAVLLPPECEDRLDSVPPIPQNSRNFALNLTHFDDDELDTFDRNIPMAKAALDLVCELIEDSHPSLVKENIVRFTLLTLGTLIEAQFHQLGEQLVRVMNEYVGVEAIPTSASCRDQALPVAMKLDELVQVCVDALPNILKQILDEESTECVFKLLLESLQSQKINQDTNLQILELLASEIIRAASQLTPAYSA